MRHPVDNVAVPTHADDTEVSGDTDPRSSIPALVEPGVPVAAPRGPAPLPELPPEVWAAAFPPEVEPTPPPPYRVRMADGVVVALDLTVYLGRAPSVPRIAIDKKVRLVAVPSAGKQVSATHLELRMSGDAVVATDMLSTNGSIVTVPGSVPHTLLRGESAVVTPGTLIDLGDGNVLELLSPELIAVPEPVEDSP